MWSIASRTKSWQIARQLHTTRIILSDLSRLEPCQSERMTDIGTRRIFNSDHDMFRESVRRYFREEVIPYHAQWEKDGEVSDECWLKAGEAGLLLVAVPAEKGGLGGDWLSSAVVHEEQAYANCSGPGFGLHSDIAGPYISRYGTPGQIQKYMPDLVAGRKIIAIAMTEPGAGSDLQGIRTTAVKEGDEWVLNGSKTFITNGWKSSVIIIVALTDTKAKSAAKGISLFIVEADSPGLKKGNKLKKLGFKAQDTAEIFLEDCRVPYDALLGGEAGLNQGFFMLMQELPQERLGIANEALCSCEFMFEETRDYVKQRKAFGRRIADLQVIQHELAALKTEISVTRAFVDRCNELHNVHKLDSATASMAKYWASHLCNTSAYRFLQMFGGNGYMMEYPIATAFADARLRSIYGGSNEIMKELIARQIVKK